MHALKPIRHTLYMPQAIWSVASLANTSAALTGRRAPTARINFGGPDLYNGTGRNLTLTHMLISPIGYPFETVRYSGEPVQAYFSRTDVLDRTRINLRVDGAYYLHRGFVPAHVFGEEIPTSEPLRLALGADPIPWSTRLFNIFRWTFDRPLEMMANASLEVELGTAELYETGTNSSSVRASIGLDQARDGFWPAASRMVADREIVAGVAKGFRWPVPLVTPPVTNLRAPSLSPDAKLTGTDFVQQDPGGFGAPSLFSGLSVALDQLTADAGLDTDGLDGPGLVNGLSDPGTQIASIGDRLNVRARILEGGPMSLALFRDDAPLCLVSPTMTTARVFALAKPLTLSPGQGLSAAMEIPLPVAGDQGNLYAKIQMGISFTGTLAIQ